MDPNDPNYESDPEESNGVAASKKENTEIKTLVPEMSEDDVRKAVEPLILEYFENNDPNEVLFSLQVWVQFKTSKN